MTAGSRTIVAGVDGRPATLRAALWAAQEAARRDVPLTLVAARVDDTLVTTDLERARRVVESAVAVPLVEVLLAGPAGSALAAAAAEAELLVLGARTPDGQPDGTVGATTTHLLARTTRPVVVVPAGWDLERRHEGEVVVAADPADPHGAARGPVALAGDVAARWGAPMLAAAVLPREPGHREVARGRRMLDGILAGVEACRGMSFVDEVVRHGDPADELIDLVGPQTGLLVLGAHGAVTSSDPAPGPVCRRVVREARCPVAVVPPGVPGVRTPDRRPAAAGGPR